MHTLGWVYDFKLKDGVVVDKARLVGHGNKSVLGTHFFDKTRHKLRGPRRFAPFVRMLRSTTWSSRLLMPRARDRREWCLRSVRFECPLHDARPFIRAYAR